MSRLSEIAHLAQVSVGTVSHVLSGKGDERRISKTTQENVLQAAVQLGYINETQKEDILLHRQNNRTNGNRHNTTVPIFTFMFRATTPVTVLGELLNGIQRIQTGTNFSFMTNMVSYGGQDQHNLISLAQTMNTDGIIVIGSTEKDKEELESISLSIPLVFINRPSQKYSSVVIDNETVKQVISQRFFQQGYKNVYFITTKGFITDYKMPLDEGKARFLSAYEKHGISAHIFVRNHEEASEYGYNATLKALDDIPRPDAIFYSSDIAAFGGLRAFIEKKMSIPGEIELVACGTDYILTRIVPFFSSIRYALDEMVEYSLNILINDYYKRDVGRKSILLDPVFCFRD